MHQIQRRHCGKTEPKYNTVVSAGVSENFTDTPFGSSCTDNAALVFGHTARYLDWPEEYFDGKIHAYRRLNFTELPYKNT